MGAFPPDIPVRRKIDKDRDSLTSVCNIFGSLYLFFIGNSKLSGTCPRFHQNASNEINLTAVVLISNYVNHSNFNCSENYLGRIAFSIVQTPSLGLWCYLIPYPRLGLTHCQKCISGDSSWKQKDQVAPGSNYNEEFAYESRPRRYILL